MNKFSIVVAHTRNLGIGYKNKLPWPQLKEDMNRFRKLHRAHPHAALCDVVSDIAL